MLIYYKQTHFRKLFQKNLIGYKINNTNISKFCSQTTQPELENVQHISQFRSGLQYLKENKLNQAESEFKECLKIFKSINQTDSLAYLYILKKYTQVIFMLKRYPESEKLFKANIELSKKIFPNKLELTFPSYRNLVAFYTYTDIAKASNLVDELLSQNIFDIKVNKYLSFAAGAIKLLNNEYTQAYNYLSNNILYTDLPANFQAFNLHNLALLYAEIKREYELTDERQKDKFAKENSFVDFKYDKESFILYKQCLAKLEIEERENKLNDEEKVLINSFLSSEDEMYKNKELKEEEKLINSFKNNKSGITITNIAEMFFEKGKEYEKQTAFWLKLGVKHYENYEKENIARHLIIFALFYSQLGQTMLAEGLYRKSIEILKNVNTKINLIE